MGMENICALVDNLTFERLFRGVVEFPGSPGSFEPEESFEALGPKSVCNVYAHQQKKPQSAALQLASLKVGKEDCGFAMARVTERFRTARAGTGEGGSGS